MPRRAAKIEEIRSQYTSVVLVDTGDLFGVTSNAVKHRYVAEAYGRLAYDAVNIGDQDCVEGAGFLLEQAQTHGLPLISSTVTAAGDDWRTAVIPWRLAQHNGLRIGIIGSASPKAFRFLDPVVRGDLTITTTDTILTYQVERLRKQCDLIVVLSHAGFEADQALARAVSGIDVIVGGHSQTLLQAPAQVGRTLIVQGGKNSEHLGMLTLNLKNSRIRTFAHTLIPLDSTVAADPGMERLVTGYTDYLKMKRRRREAAMIAPRHTVADCTPCHLEQTERWRLTSHAHAFETLARDGKQDNPECLGCHVTTDGVETESVQCLSCHPVTADHGQIEGITAIPQVTEDLCRTCHDAIQDPAFDFVEMRPLIIHSSQR